MKTRFVWLTGCVLVMGLGTARAQAGGPADGEVAETVREAMVDLDAIVAESRRYPDAVSGERIRKLAERLRTKLAPLAPARAQVANKPAAGGAGSVAGYTGVRARTSGTGGAMAEADFKEVMRELASKSLDAGRLSVVQGAIDAGGRFNTAQIGQMVGRFTSEDMRIEAAGRLWPRCTESDYAPVYAKIDSPAGKRTLRARVEGRSDVGTDTSLMGAPKPEMGEPLRPPKLRSHKP